MAIDALTDPDEIALYEQYGPNWRRIIGSGMRDRGGRYDRSMRFNHGVPTGFLTRPVAPQAFSPVPSIDTGAYEKYRIEYDRLMQEYDSLLKQYNNYTSNQNDSYQDTAFDQQQQYYQDNFEQAYGQNNPNSSQTSQYTNPQYTNPQNTSPTELLTSPSSPYLMNFNPPPLNIGGDMYAGSFNKSLGGGQVKPNPNTIFISPVQSFTPQETIKQRIIDTAPMFAAPAAKPVGNPADKNFFTGSPIPAAPKVVQPVKKINSAKPVKAM